MACERLVSLHHLVPCVPQCACAWELGGLFAAMGQHQTSCGTACERLLCICLCPALHDVHVPECLKLVVVLWESAAVCGAALPAWSLLAPPLQL